MVESVGDIDRTGGIHGDAERVAQARGRGRPAVAPKVGFPIARNGRDDFGFRVPHANEVVVRIRDIQPAIDAQRNAGRSGKACRKFIRHALVAVFSAVAGDGVDQTCGNVHFTDASIECVGNIKVAFPIDRQAAWSRKPGL